MASALVQVSRGRRPVLVALLLALCLGSVLLRAQPRPGPADPQRLLLPGAGTLAVELRGRLLSDPQPDLEGPGCRVLLQLAGGRSELQFPRCPRLQEGWQLQASGRLRRPRPAVHPLLPGAAERLARQGVWSQLRVEQWHLLARPATPVADLRRRMATALLAVGDPQAGSVLAALVLGSAVVPVPLAVRDAFRAAGLSHALAASGFHLTVLLGAVMAFGRFGPPALRWLLAFGAMGLFLLLAGPQPSVVRAVAMAALAFVVRESGRRLRPLGLLLVCVLLMLLAAPGWVVDVGFQLSVAATAGLLISAAPLEQWWRRRGLPGWGADAIAVPLAASLWTLPLQLLHFGALPLYAVPANLLAAPLLTPLTLGAMAMAVAAVAVPPLLAPLGWLLLPLTRLFVGLAQLVAALPMAQWQLGLMPPLLVLLVSAGLLPWLLPASALAGLPSRCRRPLGAALLALAIGLHLVRLAGDQLLLVQEGPRSLLLARHGGRGALISRQADGISCGHARRLAFGLGLQRFDWILLLDPLAAEQPACWHGLTPTLLASQDGSPALVPGQRLQSPGLVVTPLASDSRALLLQAGRQRWGLLPDQQAWWSWRRLGGSRAPGWRGLDGLWLGFSAHQRDQLPQLPANRLWRSAAGSSSGWRQA